jgi:hypothetical protein
VKNDEAPSRVTKVTVLTKDKVAFGQFIETRKIHLETVPYTEVWQGVESAFTIFSLSLSPAIGDVVYREWCELQDPSSGYPILD